MDGVVPQSVLFAERTSDGDQYRADMNLQAAEACNPIADASPCPAGLFIRGVGHQLALALSYQHESLFRGFVPHCSLPRC